MENLPCAELVTPRGCMVFTCIPCHMVGREVGLEIPEFTFIDQLMVPVHRKYSTKVAWLAFFTRADDVDLILPQSLI